MPKLPLPILPPPHFRMTPEQRIEAGVHDGLIRLSVGIEDARDIIKDLAHGLDNI